MTDLSKDPTIISRYTEPTNRQSDYETGYHHPDDNDAYAQGKQDARNAGLQAAAELLERRALECIAHTDNYSSTETKLLLEDEAIVCRRQAKAIRALMDAPVKDEAYEQFKKDVQATCGYCRGGIPNYEITTFRNARNVHFHSPKSTNSSEYYAECFADDMRTESPDFSARLNDEGAKP